MLLKDLRVRLKKCMECKYIFHTYRIFYCKNILCCITVNNYASSITETGVKDEMYWNPYPKWWIQCEGFWAEPYLNRWGNNRPAHRLSIRGPFSHTVSCWMSPLLKKILNKIISNNDVARTVIVIFKLNLKI